MRWSWSETYIVMRVLTILYDCSHTSHLRTPTRNQRVGGAPRSRHQLSAGGTAWDLVPDRMDDAARLVAAAKKLGFTAIDEGSHVHIHLEPGVLAPPAASTSADT